MRQLARIAHDNKKLFMSYNYIIGVINFTLGTSVHDNFLMEL